jgi:hypothetical protein
MFCQHVAGTLGWAVDSLLTSMEVANRTHQRIGMFCMYKTVQQPYLVQGSFGQGIAVVAIQHLVLTNDAKL